MWLRGQLPRWLSLAGGRTRQILLGSAVFTGLAALFPLLRFSGHHELEHALQHGIHAGGWALLALALGKVLALALCLASGWKGGEFFPALFAGAALAAAVHLLLPGIGLTVAIMGSAGAIATVVLGKPLAVLLIVLLLAGSAAPGALFSGVLVGYFFRQYLLPRAWLAHAGAGHGHAP